ncbi:MAG TPA: hypothetical protein PKH77_26885, partial [Anaerolineae bacterium]|nr:hypothetical protein [Anaerolineae bacterium]
MKTGNRFLNLSLIVCLVLGWTIYLPIGTPDIALAESPPPPVEENEFFAPAVSPPPPAITQEDIEMRASMESLELALQQGPEAVLALGKTLRGAALDLAMNDIVAAHRQLTQQAPPQAETAPISPGEETAALQAQAELEALSRAQALTQREANGKEDADTNELPPQASPAAKRPTADLTVGSAPCTYTTIASAMLAANPGDRLLLEGGVVFTTNLSVQKSLTFQGGYDGCGSGSSARTTINGNNAGRVMYIYENLEVALENLNIINGNSTGNGAGIFVRWNTHVRGTNLEIYGNTSGALGGGVRLWGSSATFTNTNIYDNVAVAGAGVYAELYDGYAPTLNLPYYADVYSNDALTGSGLGGGVYMREGTLDVTECSDIYSNRAVEGGGVYVISSTLTIDGDCSEIMFNSATGNGGGIRAQGSTINVDQDAELYSNTAGTSGTGNGGGAYLDNSDLWGDKALIYYNTADDDGGGVYATNDSLFDMDLSGYPCSGPRCSQLSYNT